MSVVSAIINSVDKGNEHPDIPLIEMKQVMERAEEAQHSVCQSFHSHYVTLSSIMNIGQLQADLKNCLKDISALELNIKEEVIPSVKGSATEIETVTLRWKETKVELEATEFLLETHTLLEESLTSLLSSDFHTAVDRLIKVEDLLREASTRKVESQLEIISALRDELCLRRSNVVFKIEEVWNKLVSFSEDEESREEKGVRLYIRDVESNAEDQQVENVNQMLSALNALGELQRFIRSFGKNLLEHFITPILCECNKLEINTIESKSYELHVTKPSEPTKVNDPTSAIETLATLEMMFRFLSEHFTWFTFEENGKEVTFISLLGKEIGSEFIKLILDNCLEESVPCDRKNLQSFSEVQRCVEEFHNMLVHIGFYGEDHKSLLDYVSNVETVYGNKTCSNILMKARNLMIKALHVTAVVSPMSPDGPLVAADEFGNELKETSLRMQHASSKTFNFPKCKISVSVCELVNLIYDTLEEGCISTPDFAARLFNTVRNILSMYSHVIPMAHAHSITAAPEQSALVHNNCLFLSHHALLIGSNYIKRYPESLRNSSLTTTDLGYLIRSSGCEVFLKAMQSLKSDLLDTLRKGLESNSTSALTSVTPLHSSVQECLKQLQRIRGAWYDLLPSSVYSKSMGTLVGSVVEDLVLRIVALEEISADEATGLINVFSLLITNVPALFHEGDEATAAADVVAEVRLWDKMKELSIVLGASLRDLDERWSAGKGPLAHHFAAAEVKHLIRAIFTNTERRAQLLAKIK